MGKNTYNSADLSISAILKIADAGYPVFPIRENSKHPFKKKPDEEKGGFYLATTDSEQIESWARERDKKRCNWAVRPIGFVILDVDNLADGSPNPWPHDPKKREDLTFCTAICQTRSGAKQYYFRLPEGKTYRCTRGDLAPKVDTRGHDGYALIPPSKINGKPYRFLEDHELDIPPEKLSALPDWLEKELDALEAARPKEITRDPNAPPPPPCEVKTSLGIRTFVNTSPEYHDKALDALEAAGWQFHSQTTDGKICYTRPGKCPSLGLSATWNAPEVREKNHGFPRFHVFSSNGGDFEEGKSYSAYDILEKLRPDWASELEAVRQELAQATQEQEEAPVEAATTLTDLGFVSLWDKTLEPAVCIVPGLFPAGLSLISSDPKAGKSTLARQITVDLVTGNGRWANPSGPVGVAWLSAEDSPGRKVLPELVAMGCTRADIEERVAWFDCLPKSKRPFCAIDEAFAILKKTIQLRPDIKVFFLDPLGSFLANANKKANDSDDVRQALDPLHRICLENGLALIILGHNKKDQAATGQQKVAGTVQITATVRTTYIIERAADIATVKLAGTNEEGLIEAFSFTKKLLDGRELEEAKARFEGRWLPEWNTLAFGKLEYCDPPKKENTICKQRAMENQICEMVRTRGTVSASEVKKTILEAFPDSSKTWDNAIKNCVATSIDRTGSSRATTYTWNPTQ